MNGTIFNFEKRSKGPNQRRYEFKVIFAPLYTFVTQQKLLLSSI